jgi:hypothetical protein
VTTKLYCPRCSECCGEAKLLDDPDVVHVSFVVGKRRGEYSGLTVHVTQGRTLRLDEPDGWPLDWRCGQCRATVRLTVDRGRRVGREEWIVTCSMPSDS